MEHVNIGPDSISLSWRVHPARQRPCAAVLTLAVIGALAWATALAAGSMLAGWAAAAVLVLSLNRFFFPSHFVLDERGITAVYPLARQHLEWRQLRRFVHDRHGAYLSTRRRRSPLDAYRGMQVLFGSHRDEVVRAIRALLPQEASPSCAG